MGTIERLTKLVEVNCRAVIDDDHDVTVTAAEGSENVVFEVHCTQGDVGLIIGRQCLTMAAVDDAGSRAPAASIPEYPPSHLSSSSAGQGPIIGRPFE